MGHLDSAILGGFVGLAWACEEKRRASFDSASGPPGGNFIAMQCCRGPKPGTQPLNLKRRPNTPNLPVTNIDSSSRKSNPKPYSKTLNPEAPKPEAPKPNFVLTQTVL